MIESSLPKLLKPIKVGNIIIDIPLLLAPMAGVTDPPFREIINDFGCVGLMFSEMIASKSLFIGNRDKSISKIRNNSSKIFAVQIAGNDPYYMAEAARLNQDLGANIIDINFGCPVKKVVKGFAGSAIMKDEKLAKQIMESVVKAVKIPVTVKMRLGWDSNNINSPKIAKIAEDVGIQMVTVHARTRSQMYSGKANWKLVADVKNVVTIPVIVNGDIADTSTLEQALAESKADGAMIARGIYGKPWLFRQIFCELMGKKFEKPTGNELLNLIIRHFNLMRNYYGDRESVCLFKKHLGWYSQGMKNSSQFRNRVNGIFDCGALLCEVEGFWSVS